MKTVMRFACASFVFLFLALVPFHAPRASELRPVAVTKDDKCKVCGMFVAKYKNWVSQIVFTDGTYAAFDGPKDMFKYYFDLPRYNPAKKQSDIAVIYVIEYYSARPINAIKAWYVLGSNVYGPMGAELVPVASEAEAKEFVRDHRGSKVVTFDQLTPALIP